MPTFGILVTPLSCAKMQAYNGDDFECWGAHRVVSLVLSLGTLCLYLPFGLASSLVFHEYVPMLHWQLAQRARVTTL